MWNPTPGHYTRYGAVRPTARREPDDRMVIMGSGDEVRAALPRRRAAAAAGRMEARLPAAGGRLGQGRRRQHGLLADRRCRCRSTA